MGDRKGGGSGRTGRTGGPQPLGRHSAILRKALGDIEDRIGKLNYEEGYLLDSQGNVLNRYRASQIASENPNHLVLTAQDVLLERPDTVFTHNHPNQGLLGNGVTLSDGDILAMMQSEVGEYRATSHGFVYGVRFHGHKPSKDDISWDLQMAKNEAWPLAQTRNASPAQFNYVYRREIINILARQYRWTIIDGKVGEV